MSASVVRVWLVRRSAAGPVIAAFSAAKVEMKANSRVEFILAEPFTFARPPVTNAPQGQ